VEVVTCEPVTAVGHRARHEHDDVAGVAHQRLEVGRGLCRLPSSPPIPDRACARRRSSRGQGRSDRLTRCSFPSNRTLNTTGPSRGTGGAGFGQQHRWRDPDLSAAPAHAVALSAMPGSTTTAWCPSRTVRRPVRKSSKQTDFLPPHSASFPCDDGRRGGW
jgi:hypothetical protein